MIMKLSDFDYQLPPELIAKYPLAQRSNSKLLQVNVATQKISQHLFKELPELLKPTDLLVFNNTKVLPARLFAHKPTGGRVEILLERILNDQEMLARCRGSFKVGQEFILTDAIKFIVTTHERLYHLKLIAAEPLLTVLKKYGHMPLPPYIDRSDELTDQERYQTVYAAPEGSVAAPTAGLHFDKALFATLAARGIEHTFVTLHVGAGTFQPVKTENISEHQMHGEWYEISSEAAAKINEAKAAGQRIIAVGTTSVRTLEAATHDGKVNAGAGETHIFIYPGYRFKMIDGMITNFHLPKSSLLMLVAAFAGLALIRQAYQLAIVERYRFFSYGDAMLIF
jgi:S-adenosylmethionine:tRNA ribosyltransferase-isomerase